MAKQQHVVVTRYGQGQRMRNVPMSMFGVRHFPAGMPEAAKATPGVLDQLPLTLKCHFGDTEQEAPAGTRGRFYLVRIAGVKLEEKNWSEGSSYLIKKSTMLGKLTTQTHFSSVAVVITPFD